LISSFLGDRELDLEFLRLGLLDRDLESLFGAGDRDLVRDRLVFESLFGEGDREVLASLFGEGDLDEVLLFVSFDDLIGGDLECEREDLLGESSVIFNGS